MSLAIDITGLIEEEMWVDNPLIPSPSIEIISETDGQTGWEAHRITLTTLTGTYLETDAHIQKNGKHIANVPVNQLIRPATILQLEGVEPGTRITASKLDACAARPFVGDAILIGTGWDRQWNLPEYVTHSPNLTLDAVEWIMQFHPPIVGGDFPAFDSQETNGAVVRTILISGSLLLAPVVSLNQVMQNRMVLVALPMKIKNVCGAPCRAVLLDVEELKEMMIPNV